MVSGVFDAPSRPVIHEALETLGVGCAANVGVDAPTGSGRAAAG
jgi:hypothetical protein